MLVCCDAPSSQSRRVSYGNTEGQTVQYFLQCTNWEKMSHCPLQDRKRHWNHTQANKYNLFRSGVSNSLLDLNKNGVFKEVSFQGVYLSHGAYIEITKQKQTSK